jgi:hypothetical protein
MTTERPVLTTIIVALLTGTVVGGGGVLLATRHRAADATATAASTPASIEATAGVVAAATADDTTDAETRRELARAPAVDLLAQAVVDLADPATTVAAYAYAQCVAGSQGKQEGSAAYGCTDRGRQLDAAVGALIAARAAP